MSGIDLKRCGAEFVLYLRAFTEEGEEIPRLVLDRDAQGNTAVRREGWEIRYPLGSTLGGPPLDEEHLGAHLLGKLAEMEAEITRHIAAQLQAPVTEGRE